MTKINLTKLFLLRSIQYKTVFSVDVPSTCNRYSSVETKGENAIKAKNTE